MALVDLIMWIVYKNSVPMDDPHISRIKGLAEIMRMLICSGVPVCLLFTQVRSHGNSRSQSLAFLKQNISEQFGFHPA